LLGWALVTIYAICDCSKLPQEAVPFPDLTDGGKLVVRGYGAGRLCMDARTYEYRGFL